MVQEILVEAETHRDNMADSFIKQTDPNKKEYYITDVSIITLEDNLQHNYFSSARWSRYNQNPISEAITIMPYVDDIAGYWKKYAGTVVISGKLSSQTVNTNSADFFMNHIQKPEVTQNSADNTEYNKQAAQRLINDNYNYSYIGKVSRFKQKGDKFIVYLEDLGWKFSQKVPKEFRDSFIANQALDDAFQAICEFMDIEFAYSIG